MFTFRSLLGVAAAAVLVGGAAWGISELLTPHGVWQPWERREKIEWAAGFMGILGLIGGIIGLDIRRRRLGFRDALRVAALPSAVAAPLLFVMYAAFGAGAAAAFLGLISGGVPMLLGAVIAFPVVGPRPR